MSTAIRKLVQGMLVAVLIIIPPTLGNTAILRAPHLWIMIAVGILGSLFQPKYNPFARRQGDKDRGTANQIIWSIYGTQVMVICEATYLRYPGSAQWDLLTTAALSLMVAGLVLRSWAVFCLGKYFTWHIEVQKKQSVVRTGPYAFMRHPGYFGAFITYVSTALFMRAWISAVLCVVFLLFAFVRRIYHEEGELRRELGDAYETYCKTVKRFLPGIW